MNILTDVLSLIRRSVFAKKAELDEASLDASLLSFAE